MLSAAATRLFVMVWRFRQVNHHRWLELPFGNILWGGDAHRYLFFSRQLSFNNLVVRVRHPHDFFSQSSIVCGLSAPAGVHFQRLRRLHTPVVIGPFGRSLKPLFCSLFPNTHTHAGVRAHADRHRRGPWRLDLLPGLQVPQGALRRPCRAGLWGPRPA